MSKKFITVPHAPKLPFTPAIKAGDFIFVSGQVGYEDPKTGKEVKGIEAQTRQCLENIKELLEAGGASMADVVKVNVYLRHPEDFGKMNEVYKKYFVKEPPTRCTVVPNLVTPNMLVEIECIAYHP